MQPSGALHLGNWQGALANWVRLQDQYRCFFMVADWHALTTRYQNTETLPELTREMVIDWLAAGLDPERAVIFCQSWVPAHAELALLLGMITPLGWLERVPSYKEKLRELAHREVHSYGFLGYPVLQTADIALYRARWVPVGQDQVPHVELSREVVRRFHALYGEGVLVEPEPLLTEANVLPGLDGRKMSKSYQNTLTLRESPEAVRSKVATMVTDPARVRRSDPGHPEVCPVFQLHRVFSAPDQVAEIDQACRTAAIGCVECKGRLAAAINRALDPLRERRAYWEAHGRSVGDILKAGSAAAQAEAAKTMEAVREAMSLSPQRLMGGDGG
ncbi:MAG: tryptophan--tRNA ligase [Firmicutes bacterium]|nr:tryptophan--tRNA ligase [Alicyclobacillaceae bacterium]MCL6496714.1 tryptophan--tRNA ligase [Bacillota bacterium]